MNELLDTKKRELQELVEKYPDQIPVKAAAAFLHCKVESLRAAIVNGNFKPGIWYKTLNGRTEFMIYTFPFINWFSGGSFWNG